MTATFAARPAARYRELHGMDPAEAAGLVQLRQPQHTATLVGVYRAAEAGIEDSGWVTVCEVHATCCVHDTRWLAERHAADPAGWCEPCREAGEAAPHEPHGYCRRCHGPVHRYNGGPWQHVHSPTAGIATPHAAEPVPTCCTNHQP